MRLYVFLGSPEDHYAALARRLCELGERLPMTVVELHRDDLPLRPRLLHALPAEPPDGR